MSTRSSLLLASLFGCAPEYHFDDVPQPDSVREAPLTEVEPCPDVYGPPPGYRSTSAILEVIGHCSEGMLQLGIDAVDVDPYQVEAVAYLVDLSDPNDRGEHWALYGSGGSTPPTWPGECMDARYWERIASFDEAPEGWRVAGSRYRCNELTEASSLTYAYALFDAEGAVLDCALVGADPEGLRRSKDRGPRFPLDDCHDAPFALDWARQP